jgi:hypothetical protein
VAGAPEEAGAGMPGAGMGGMGDFLLSARSGRLPPIGSGS